MFRYRRYSIPPSSPLWSLGPIQCRSHQPNNIYLSPRSIYLYFPITPVLAFLSSYPFCLLVESVLPVEQDRNQQPPSAFVYFIPDHSVRWSFFMLFMLPIHLQGGLGYYSQGHACKIPSLCERVRAGYGWCLAGKEKMEDKKREYDISDHYAVLDDTALLFWSVCVPSCVYRCRYALVSISFIEETVEHLV